MTRRLSQVDDAARGSHTTSVRGHRTRRKAAAESKSTGLRQRVSGSDRGGVWFPRPSPLNFDSPPRSWAATPAPLAPVRARGRTPRVFAGVVLERDSETDAIARDSAVLDGHVGSPSALAQPRTLGWRHALSREYGELGAGGRPRRPFWRSRKSGADRASRTQPGTEARRRAIPG